MSQLGPDRWQGSFDTVALGRHAFQVEAWVDPYASLEERDRAQAGGRPGGSRERARGGGGPDRGRRRRGCAAPDRAAVYEAVRAMRAPGEVAERAAAATAPAVSEALARSTERRERERSPTYRWTSIASGPASAPGTSCSRARSAASPGCRSSSRGWPSWASTSSTCRRSTRSAPPTARGATTPRPPSPATPAARGRSAARPGGHTAVNPELGTLAEFEGLVMAARGARHGDRPRLRDPVLARPPLAARSPRVVPPPARRDAEVRREPAQAVPGHLQPQLRQPRLARPVAGAAGGADVLGRARGEHLPGGQPPHQAHRRSGSG